jgi:iron complex transport system ATP-binding protein
MKLEASSVTVQRGGRNIVDDVALAAGAGELVVIVGANGAGKSTLLSVLAGLIKPERGTVRLDGRAVDGIPARDLARRRAYLPQNPRCEWPISVSRLIALGLTPSLPAVGRMPPAYQERIDATLLACDLAAQREQPATTLSGGELARAMLARALVGDPEAVIIDEPITGLDPKHALDAMSRLREWADRGKLVIVALHDLTLAARYATRFVAMRAGRVVADGPLSTTLTPELLRDIFDVDASVSGTGSTMSVDFFGPAKHVRHSEPESRERPP